MAENQQSNLNEATERKRWMAVDTTPHKGLVTESDKRIPANAYTRPDAEKSADNNTQK